MCEATAASRADVICGCSTISFCLLHAEKAIFRRLLYNIIIFSPSCHEKFFSSHRTVPNEAGDHRAARTVPGPLGQGSVRLAIPYAPRASAASALAGHRTWRDLNACYLRLL